VLHILCLRLRLFFTEDAPEVPHAALLVVVAIRAGGWVAEGGELGAEGQTPGRFVQGQALLPGRFNFLEHSLVVVTDGRKGCAGQGHAVSRDHVIDLHIVGEETVQHGDETVDVFKMRLFADFGDAALLVGDGAADQELLLGDVDQDVGVAVAFAEEDQLERQVAQVQRLLVGKHQGRLDDLVALFEVLHEQVVENQVAADQAVVYAVVH